MVIYLGSDHAGFKLKETIKSYLMQRGLVVKDLGNTKLEPRDDYPDYASKVAKAVRKPSDRGILFCGSGAGICIAANKFKGIRAVVGYSVQAAKHSRVDNDSNILCLGGRELNVSRAKQIVDTWLREPFSKKARHIRRLKKIKRIEKIYEI